MSKEIGKLLELLNEYEIERERKFEGFKRDRLPYHEWSNKELGDGTITYLWLNKEDYKGEELYGNSANAVLISKSYGFIKWLVENKKFKRYSAYKNLLDGDYVKFGSDGPVIPSVNGQLYDSILCGLAISDEPIELLISILK